MTDIQTIKLPRVAIGPYGRVLADLSPEQVIERFVEHEENVFRLKRELAAELQRRDIAFQEVQAHGR